MGKQRWQPGEKNRSFTCGNCKKPYGDQADRFFDNKEFPKKPYCLECYKHMVRNPKANLPYNELQEAIAAGVREGLACMVNELEAIRQILEGGNDRDNKKQDNGGDVV